MPARMSWSIICGEELAGPMVQTILERLKVLIVRVRRDLAG
jgi:hypothetical protein